MSVSKGLFFIVKGNHEIKKNYSSISPISLKDLNQMKGVTS